MFKKLVHLLLEPFKYDSAGGVQWFYTLVIAIHCMFAWRFSPDIALVFSILWGVHFFSIYLISYMQNHDTNISDEGILYRFLVINIILLFFGLLTCWWWTIITIIITKLAYKLASYNYCIINNQDKSSLYSIVIFIILLILIFSLSTTFFNKIFIVLLFMIYHYINGKMARRCYCINCVFDDFDYIIMNIKMRNEVKRFFKGKKH